MTAPLPTLEAAAREAAANPWAEMERAARAALARAEAEAAGARAILATIQRQRGGSAPPRSARRRPQWDMAAHVIEAAGRPLTSGEILAGVEAVFGMRLKRECVMSTLYRMAKVGDVFEHVGESFDLLRGPHG